MKKVIAGIVVLQIFFAPVAFMFAGFVLWYTTGNTTDPSFTVSLDYFNGESPSHRTQLINYSMIIYGVLSVISLGSVFKYYMYQKRLVFGQRKLATLREVRKAGLLDEKQGIFFGYYNGQPLFDNSQLHVLLIAESGTGKGVSLIIPNLFLWGGSVIVTDMKKENYRYTSGYRNERGQATYCFDPFSKETHRINPLSYLDEENPIDHFQRIAYIVYPNNDRGEKIWSASARSLFIGIAILIYLERGKEAVTFANIISTQATLDLSKLDSKLAKLKGKQSILNKCWQILKQHADTPDRTRGGIEKEFSSALDIFLNPTVSWATGGNDVPLERLRKDPITLYLNCTPSNVARISFVMRMIMETVNMLHTQEEFAANPEHKYPLLLLNDEQHNFFGKMELMLKAASFYRSYGIRIFSVYQSHHQIKIDYTQDGAQAYIDNHNIKLYYCPQNNEKAAQFAKEIGETTVFTKSKSRGGGRPSTNEAPQRREAYLPDELQKMLGETHGLLFKGGNSTIRFKKAVWWKEDIFKKREMPPIELPKVTDQQLEEFLIQSNTGQTFNPAKSDDKLVKLATLTKEGAPDEEIKATISSMIMEGSEE